MYSKSISTILEGLRSDSKVQVNESVSLIKSIVDKDLKNTI